VRHETLSKQGSAEIPATRIVVKPAGNISTPILDSRHWQNHFQAGRDEDAHLPKPMMTLFQETIGATM